MIDLTLTQLAELAGGSLSPNSNPNLILNQVIIDSRKMADGSLFVALKGNNFDGHQFIAKTITNTNAAIVNKSSNFNLPNLILVEDTSLALGYLAGNYRKLFSLPIVAITGSNGKTTVKEMLKKICELEFGTGQVLATSGNLNNHLGMPLTLLNLNYQHKVTIVEMGMNHSGEIAYLSNLCKPTIAVVNNVMLAHAGYFKSIDEIAMAKGEIFSGLIARGTACINLSVVGSNKWLNQIDNSCHIMPYATSDTNCFIESYDEQGNFIINYQEKLVAVKLNILGMHNYKNALTAFWLAIQLNCNLDSIVKGLERYSGFTGRLEIKTAFNGAQIIDDTYNANPDSVIAALQAVANLRRPLWLIFADLKELGEFAIDNHKLIALEAMKFKIDKLLTIGELTQITYDNFNGDKKHFRANQDIVEYCLANLPSKATLLVKGSNSMNLAEIVKKIVK